MDYSITLMTYLLGNEPPKHNDNCGCFRCTHVAWNKGLHTGLIPRTAFKLGSVGFTRKHTEETKKKLSQLLRGRIILKTRDDNHYLWKGEDASYSSKHKWIEKHWKKTGICKECGAVKKTQWHNVDGKYNRGDKSSWVELCVGCHIKEHGKAN